MSNTNVDIFIQYQQLFTNFIGDADNTVKKIPLDRENIHKTFIKLGADSQKKYNNSIDNYLVFEKLSKDNKVILELLKEIINWTKFTLDCVDTRYDEKSKEIIETMTRNNIKDTVMANLETSRALLLEGPPNHDNHFIVPEKAEEWMKSQKTPDRQRLAKKVLNNIRYVSHGELLAAIQNCVEKVKSKLVPDAPVTFLIPRDKKKSNFYITLLFLHFWLERGYPVNYILQNVVPGFLFGNIIDVDDMAYSGNQTHHILSRIYRDLCNKFNKIALSCLHNNSVFNSDFQKSWKYLPKYVIETYLQKYKVNYILTRIFMSEYSFNNFNDPGYLSFPIKIVTANVLEYMKNVDNTNREKIHKLFKFGNQNYSGVYFNHKVANNASTMLYPITLGIVPEKPLYFEEYMINDVSGEGVNFKPFIKGCNSDTRLNRLKTLTRKNIADELDDSFRCPGAWYKKIDYNLGRYMHSGGTRKNKNKMNKKCI